MNIKDIIAIEEVKSDLGDGEDFMNPKHLELYLTLEIV